MHKKTFLKPVIKSAEFCSTCHKVGLPYGLNHYKDFVRGQDHYTTLPAFGSLRARGAKFLLSARGQDRTAPSATWS